MLNQGRDPQTDAEKVEILERLLVALTQRAGGGGRVWVSDTDLALREHDSTRVDRMSNGYTLSIVARPLS